MTFVNQVNHRLVMSNNKLDVDVDRKTLMTKRPHVEHNGSGADLWTLYYENPGSNPVLRC